MGGWIVGLVVKLYVDVCVGGVLREGLLVDMSDACGRPASDLPLSLSICQPTAIAPTVTEEASVLSRLSTPPAPSPMDPISHIRVESPPQAATAAAEASLLVSGCGGGCSGWGPAAAAAAGAGVDVEGAKEEGEGAGFVVTGGAGGGGCCCGVLWWWRGVG